MLILAILAKLALIALGTWTTPRTWVAGELVTASMMNTHVRDNLNALLSATSTITTTGTQTALAIPAGRGPLTIFANNASLLTLQGISAGADGQELTIYSIGAGQVDIAHQHGSASAANRIINIATSGPTSLAAGSGSATFKYDATASRWRLRQHDQGASITPSFSAGDYTASAGNWTLASGDVLACGYVLRGRWLFVNIELSQTTVSSTPAALRRVIPGGFTSAARSSQGVLVNDNAAGFIAGEMQVTAAGTTMGFTKLSGNWAAATDNTGLFGMFAFEVQ